MAELAEPMSEERERPADVLTRALIVEGVSLAGLLVLLWWIGPGHQQMQHLAWRIRRRASARRQREDQEVADLRRDISRFEHGGEPGGCGC